MKLFGVGGELLGTITCGVTAVAALKAQGLSAGDAAGGGASIGIAPVAPVAPVVQPTPPPPPPPPAAPSTASYTFAPGPLGLVLHDRADGGVQISQVDGGAQGIELGVVPMSHILEINGTDVAASTRAAVVGMVKEVQGQAAKGGTRLTMKLQLPPGAEPPRHKYAAQVRELTDMGFDEASATRALEASSGDVQEAVGRLTG